VNWKWKICLLFYSFVRQLGRLRCVVQSILTLKHIRYWFLGQLAWNSREVGKLRSHREDKMASFQKDVFPRTTEIAKLYMNNTFTPEHKSPIPVLVYQWCNACRFWPCILCSGFEISNLIQLYYSKIRIKKITKWLATTFFYILV